MKEPAREERDRDELSEPEYARGDEDQDVEGGFKMSEEKRRRQGAADCDGPS